MIMRDDVLPLEPGEPRGLAFFAGTREEAERGAMGNLGAPSYCEEEGRR